MAAIVSPTSGRVAVPYGVQFITASSAVRLQALVYPDQDTYSADESGLGVGASYQWLGCPGITTEDVHDEAAQIASLQNDSNGEFYQGTILS